MVLNRQAKSVDKQVKAKVKEYSITYAIACAEWLRRKHWALSAAAFATLALALKPL